MSRKDLVNEMFSCRTENGYLGLEVMFTCKLFQIVAQATRNARSQTVDKQVWGASRHQVSDDQSSWQPAKLTMAVNSGKIQWGSARYVITSILNWILSGTRSQWRKTSALVTWSDHYRLKSNWASVLDQLQMAYLIGRKSHSFQLSWKEKWNEVDIRRPGNCAIVTSCNEESCSLVNMRIWYSVSWWERGRGWMK